jgi:hypothetical protein
MSSVHHDVHLVDAEGFDVPVSEKDNVPHDPTDPADWPAWTDNWFWEVEPFERAALEQAAFDEACDIVDSPSPSEERWLALMWSGLPPVAGGAPEYTAADRSDLEAWLDQLDRDYPPPNQISDVELGMLAGGLPLG